MKALVVGLASLCLIAPALARTTLPHACTIPSQYAAALPKEAAARRATAESERTALSNQIASFESQCSGQIVVDSAEHATCVALDRAVDANIDAYLRRLEDNQAALKGEIAALKADDGARIAELDVQIASTRAKLAADGARVSGIEGAAKEWEDAAEQARLDMQAKAVVTLRDGFVDFMLHRLTKGREREIALDEKQLKNVTRAVGDLALPMGTRALSKADLQRLLWWDHYVTAHGARFALRLGENRTNLTVLKALKEFNTLVDVVDARNAWDSKNTPENVLKAEAATLKVFVNSPQMKFMINQWDLNFSLAYLFVAEGEAMARIEQLNQLSVDSLKGIESLSALHKRQVDERSALKRLQARSAAAIAANGCPI